MSTPIFGALPRGERLQKVQASPQYRQGKFNNQSFTPDLAEGATYWKVLKAWGRKSATGKPSSPLPSIKPDFSALQGGEPSLIWFGHSSYFLCFEGLNILVDPVLGSRASPLPGMVRAFAGTSIISPADFPQLDVVLITHDHYDHLDYKTIVALRHKTNRFITTLGTGAHLQRWGIPAEKITELDWWDEAAPGNGCTLTATPTRHFSGRGMKRAQSLWAGFVLQSARHTYYLGGDSGYDVHFAEIGKRFGPFGLAILECGQYHPYWKYIHMAPEEVAQAALDLHATALLPVHWAKFSLALHPWKEPVVRLVAASAGKPFRLLMPRLGETLLPETAEFDAPYWWQLL